MTVTIHLQLIAQSASKRWNVNLKYIAVLRSNTRLKAENACAVEMHMKISGAAE